MALKKRSPADRARDEAIEAFGNAAEPLLAAPPARSEQPTPIRPSVTPELSDLRDKENPRTMLLRFENEMDLSALLTSVAALEGRKKHPMALRALRIGLEQVRSTYE
ncbi:hypothetical protein [Paenarthrobacter sp. NPDC058040]|uniref:hypothetical protein n=1 Tax=unclassified Paenarthrobacter TaxID=2634190 RepID=UPI0036DB883B